MTDVNNFFVRDNSGMYNVSGNGRITDTEIIRKARQLTAARLRRGSNALTNPQQVRDYVHLHLSDRITETFYGLFLDNRHRVIAHEDLFTGTIDAAAVYPRVVVAKVIEFNAAAVIFAHNHPSGVAEPSNTDITLTSKLSEALKLIDVRVLDHLIVGEDTITSLAERGLL